MIIRKFGIASIVCVLGLVLAMGVFPAKVKNAIPVLAKGKMRLNKTQKQELGTFHKEIQEKRKEVISKYVEYGVISKEKGDKIISRLEKRYERLEGNGFIPLWVKSKNKR